MLAHTSPVEHSIVVLVCVAMIAGYGLAWLRTPARSTVRLWCFVGSVGTFALATSPTFERLAGESFTGHMVQHLLLIVVSAPLLVLSRPVRTVSAATGHRGTTVAERRTASWWHRTGPLVAPLMFVAVLFVTHLTGIYEAALTNRFVHDLEHVAYFATAVALWSVALAAGRASAAGRIAAVFAVIAGSAFLGVVLLSASEPLIPTYVDELGAEAALDDQRAAASLMWVGGMAITLPLLLTAVWRWASTEERIAERAEALERGQGSGAPSNRSERSPRAEV